MCNCCTETCCNGVKSIFLFSKRKTSRQVSVRVWRNHIQILFRCFLTTNTHTPINSYYLDTFIICCLLDTFIICFTIVECWFTFSIYFHFILNIVSFSFVWFQARTEQLGICACPSTLFPFSRARLFGIITKYFWERYIFFKKKTISLKICTEFFLRIHEYSTICVAGPQLCDNDVNEFKLKYREMLSGNLQLCLFGFTIVSTLGSLEPNNDGLPSSNYATGPEDEWLPGPNPWVFDSASNPILEPPDFLEWILGDPAVIQLGDQIHMFANEVP